MKIKLTAEMRMRLAYAEDLDITDIVAPIIAERDALSQKLRAAQHEAEALAATVEALRGALKALSFEAQISGGIAGRNESLISATDFAHRVLVATPQQHLRDVRAEAGRAGFIACAAEFGFYLTGHLVNIVDEAADQYAASIRNGSHP